MRPRGGRRSGQVSRRGIKDLFDVAGERTLAGSRALDDAPPAKADAPIVARLKAAGAVLMGRTNMTEFAFSGVGINPHYGTPGNPWDRKRIPGGSSAGAPISVADGMAAVAIGTDTGGSVRIPAAFCGLAGLKPTQFRIPRQGATPLSTTLDSIGPIGASVACCALTDAVLAGEPPTVPEAIPVEALRLGIPQTLVLDDLEPAVAGAFERVTSALARAGARIVELPLKPLGGAPSRARCDPPAVLPELAPALPLDQRLDAERHREQPSILPVAADHGQSDGRLARRRDRNGDRATIEKIDRRGVAQYARIEPPEILILCEGRDRRRHQR